jgi:hypothetical protein
MSAELAPLFRKSYMLGGNAKVTVVSRKSGQSYTYQIREKQVEEDKTLHFVGVLTGPENTRDYSFLGTIFDGEKFVHGRKSRIEVDAPSARAFAWLWRNLDDEERVTVLHSGACSRCGRELTTPESIERGLGPVCAGKAA